MNKNTIITGAAFGALTVILGAFGAHALQEILEQTGRADNFDTAVQYQALHALALILVGIIEEKFKASSLRYGTYAMTAGIILFSGSLYILSLTGVTSVAMVTPFGGLFFIVGWVLLIYGVWKG